MTVVGDVPSAPLDPPLAPRTCGRCRQLFTGDPTLHPAAIAEWWACDDCRARLGLAPSPAASSAGGETGIATT